MPNISVIIPCYNTATYIGRCLQGLEMQQYRDFDVILIDDCSSDATPTVISQYMQKSNLLIQYFRNDYNRGPAYSRKKGIEMSEANYIAFCDSDDWYEPNYLELMVQKSQENDADMVFCAYQTISHKKNKVVQHKIEHIPKELHSRSVLTLSVDSLWVTMVRREILSTVPTPDIRNGEDMALIPLMIVHSKKFGVVNECLYNYQCRAGSASMRADEKVVDSLIRSFEHIHSNMPEEYRMECEIIGVRNLIYGGLLALFKYSFNTKKAKGILETFELTYPDWKKNSNIRYFPVYKKVFLKLAGERRFVCLKILSLIHSIITRNY